MKAIIVTGRVEGIAELRELLKQMEQNPIIKEYIDTHELVNGECFRNECYSIEFGRRKTTVYLNASAAVSC